MRRFKLNLQRANKILSITNSVLLVAVVALLALVVPKLLW